MQMHFFLECDENAEDVVHLATDAMNVRECGGMFVIGRMLLECREMRSMKADECRCI